MRTSFKTFFAILLLWLFVDQSAWGQSNVGLWCFTGTSSTGQNQFAPCSSTNPLNVIGTFTPTGTGDVNVKQWGGVATSLGQALMATSVPVAIASNQSALTVTGAGGTFPVTQSTSPWVVSNSGTFAVQAAITAASGAYASGSISSGAVASGAFSSGSIATGAMVDIVAEQTPIAPATATATKGFLLGGQYNSTQATFTNAQQGALQISARGELKSNIMDAAGNARGANVNASNELSVIVTQNTSPWVMRLNTTPSIANGSGVVPAPSSESGAGIAPVPSTAAEASHVLKASAGNVYSASATNLTTTAGFLVLLNATSAPGDGAITPLACAPLPASGAASIAYPGVPGYYGTGVTAVVTSANTCLTKTTGVITAFFSGQVQ